MSTNLEYREGERQEGESRRQASKAKREKERELELELESRARVHSGGEKKRNASGHQGARK